MARASSGFGIALLAALRPLLRPDTHAQLPATCDVLLLCHDNDRALDVGGRAYSQVLDTAGDKLAARGLTVASVAGRLSVLTGDRAHRTPASINRAIFVAAARDRIGGLLRRGRASHRHSTQFWLDLLTRHRPRLLIGIGLSPALCRAAKRLGVTTVEAMHGFGLPPDDWAHGAAARTRLSEDEEPDLFVAYDDVTLDTIRLGSLGKKSAAVLARPPFLETPTKPEDLPPFLAPAHRSRRATGVFEHVVLLTLQHGYDGERPFLANIIPNGVLHPDIEDVIRRDPKIHWLIKLHPVQLRTSGKKAVELMCSLAQTCTNVEWEQSSTATISQLLAVADVHVTMSSGTVYEAAMSGVPSAAFCPTVRPGGHLQTYFEDLVTAGWVTKDATDADTLHAWIRAAAAHRLLEQRAAFGGTERLPTTAEIVELALARKLPGLAAARQHAQMA